MDRGTVDRRHGDVFPMALSHCSHDPTQVLETVKALNRLAGHKFTNSSQLPQQPTVVQGLALERIRSAFNRAGDCPHDLQPEMALSSLLRSKNLYAEEPSNLAPYDPEKLKILRSMVVPKRLETVVPPHVLSILRRKNTMIERCPRDVEVELNKDPHACPSRPYWDPVLKFDPAARVDLIKRLHRVGIVEFRKRIKCTVGIFFVKKKSPEWIRMVVDARLTNFRHKTPPVSRLGSGVNFAHLDVSDESVHHYLKSYVGEHVGYGNELDVSDCFYQFKIPTMAQWFGIDFPKSRGFWEKEGISVESVFEDDLGVHVDVGPDEVVYPVIGAMAMGWSWALYLAHESVSFLARTCTPSASLEFRDKRPAPQLWHDSALVSTYVDNVAVVGATFKGVESRCSALSKRFSELDIPIEWTYDKPQTIFETVGVVVDFESKTIRNKPNRLWRIYHSAHAICKRSNIRPEIVEVWVGHATSVFRLAPHFLSVFFHIYRFTSSARGKRVWLWPSVKAEIKTAAALVWLTECSIGGQHIRQLDMGDSATHGYALMTRHCTIDQLHNFTQFREKWRYVAIPEQLRNEVLRLLDSEMDERVKETELQSAFSRAGVGVDLEYGKWLQQMMVEGSWLSTSSIKTQWRSTPGKKVDILVPSLITPLSDDIVAPGKFKLLWSRRWRNPSEHINVKEGRVLLSSLVRTTRVASLFGGRKCSASDNLPAILAYDKGRSGSQGMNRLCQKSAALQGATGIRWFLRHVETKRNLADEPSRRFERHRPSAQSATPFCLDLTTSTSSASHAYRHHCEDRQNKKCAIKILQLADFVPPPGITVHDRIGLDGCSGFHEAEDVPHSNSDNSGHCRSRHSSKVGGGKPVFWEVFAGCGSLSKHMKKIGFHVLPPIDIKNDHEFDLTNPRVQQLIRDIISTYDIDYIHFGTPCTVFSRARHNITNVRRGRAREIIGCELAAWTAEMCLLASQRGILWSIENPKSSRLWEFPLIEVLFAHTGVGYVDFDMCGYGTGYRKPTRILASFQQLQGLQRHCSHLRHGQVLKGRVKVDLGDGTVWANRTTLAGAYPPELCETWARISQQYIFHHAPLQRYPTSSAIGKQLEEIRTTETGHQGGQTGSMFSVPVILDAITFGQHSKAEAFRRQERRRRNRQLQEKTKQMFRQFAAFAN